MRQPKTREVTGGQPHEHIGTFDFHVSELAYGNGKLRRSENGFGAHESVTQNVFQRCEALSPSK